MRSKKFLFIMLLMVCASLGACSKNKDDGQPQTEKTPVAVVGEDSAKWAEDRVFYQLFVRSFCDSNGDGIGDFNGIAKKVDYLKELGVGAVWLMPMMESTTYHGYDVVDYYKTNPDYGTMDDFKNMLKVLHDNDIKVIIDFVVNHTSDSHAWFQDAISNVNSKYRDYYTIYSENEKPEDMSKIRANVEHRVYYYGNYDAKMPDLNYDNKNVREEVKKAAGFWLDTGIDGFRLDGSIHIYTGETEKNVEWWKEFTKYVKQKNSSAFIVGENWLGTDSSIAPYYSSMDSSFDFPMCTIIEKIAKGTIADYVKAFNKSIVKYKNDAAEPGSVVKLPIVSTMIGNHDMNRIASRVDEKSASLAAAIYMTLPGTPFIYYGDELGQKGQTPDANRREPYDWYKSATGNGMVQFEKAVEANQIYTVANDGISYEEESADANSILNKYKKLIAIRNANKVMYTGTYTTIGLNNDGLYAYTITGAEDKSTLMVVHNLRDKDLSFDLKISGKELMSDTDVTAQAGYKIGAKQTLIFKYTDEAFPIETEQFTLVKDNQNSVRMVVTVPENTPKDDKIYLSGTLNNWNECDEDFALIKTGANTYQITLYGSNGASFEYKFTRGSAVTIEQGDEQLQNRKYEYVDQQKVLNIKIDKWSDL